MNQLKSLIVRASFCLIPIFFITPIHAQFQNIEIDNSGGTGYIPNEPFIAFNPDDTLNLLVGTNLSNSYHSFDGGYNWTKVPVTSDTYGAWGDPCVVIDSYGNYYFLHLSNPTSGGAWIDRVVCERSTDGGTTWDDISAFGLNGTKKHDKETAVVDRSTNSIYVTWTQMDAYHSSNPLDSSLVMFTSSDNMAQTWTVPVRLSQYAGDSNGGGTMLRSAVPCIGPNGEIYVSWAGRNEAGSLGIIFDRSLDQGQTWLDEDKYVADFPGGSHFNIPGIYPGVGTGWSNMACDTSGGQYNGNIYINWADQRNGTDDADIWLVKSEDGGTTWSNPTRVNNDGTGKQQFFTWMTVDQITGYLYFVFYDRRNYSDNRTDVYMAVSEDGGETFTNIKISSEPFIPTEDVFFGDYNTIIAYNGMVRPIWTRLNNGTISVMTCIADYTNAVHLPEESVFSEIGTFPNPSADVINLSYKLTNSANVTIKIFDILGKELLTVEKDQFHSPGKYVKTIDINQYHLLPGIYYFDLCYNQSRLIKKFIIH
jgi:hypothetical protein